MSRAASLRGVLASRGWLFDAPVEWHASLGSTNDRLKQLARDGAREGTLVLADSQGEGRGRQGRSWASPEGNLYVSLLLRPSAEAGALVTLAAGVGVAEGLAEFRVSPRLKWPNDVMLGEKKVGGILAESSFTGASLEWIVLGIGTNVRGRLPEDLRETATSLVDAGGATAEVPAVAAAVLGHVAVWYHRLVDDGKAPVLSAWRERSLPWWGERIRAESPEGRVEGRAVGLDDEGGFVLELDDGTRRILRTGAVWRARRAG